MTFAQLGLIEPILTAVAEQGYQTPTPVQAQAIPLILQGRDLLAGAQTGTGKTASFVLPILHQLASGETQRAKRVRALILVPTRELAQQVEEDIVRYGKHLSLTAMAMFGGVDSAPQKQRLLEGVDILVATPGRLLDMIYQKAIRFDELEYLVLDEADRMLDMGFIADIRKIIERLPEQKQSLLFSATLTDDVRFLAQDFTVDPAEVSVASDQSSKPDITQWLITVDKDQKSALLSHLIQEHDWQQALIFIRTKHGAAKLVSQLEKRGITADSIHGDRSQAMREQILADFRSGRLSLLVATGVAARGIDIDQLERVVNYDLPDDADDYIHRIGRTGRAGASGEAISLVSKDDFKRLCAIESRLGHLIERKEVAGFEAKKTVPVSILNHVPKHKQKNGEHSRQGGHRKRDESQNQRDRDNKRGNRRHNDGPWKERLEQPSGGSQDPWGKPNSTNKPRRDNKGNVEPVKRKSRNQGDKDNAGQQNDSGNNPWSSWRK
ncbi:DEAD/DEAH box helicase [Oceanospirillum beijerinckii]|uniref:DEAD/DEAH box helicase n=1 Tax=Oceanospirillum beijerinckii TaxID=64976 RepID=UPI000A010D6B